MEKYQRLMGEYERNYHDFDIYRFQSKAVVVWLRNLVDEFNKDLEDANIPPSKLQWNYSKGKTLGLENGPDFIQGFNKAFKGWREMTGCEANFFAHSREGKVLERLEILDIVNSLYANTDRDGGAFEKMMDDAVKEAGHINLEATTPKKV